MNPLWLIPAFVGGAWLGVLAMALLVAARRGDDALSRSTPHASEEHL